MTSSILFGVLYNYPDKQGGNTLTSGSYQELSPKIGMLWGVGSCMRFKTSISWLPGKFRKEPVYLHGDFSVFWL